MGSSQLKILCIDDADIVRATVVRELKALGHLVEEAPNADIAKSLMTSTKFNLTFLDINMPGKTGLELLEELNNEKVDYGPVVLLTTDPSEETKRLGRDLGVKAWIVKPMKPGMLQMVVERLAR